MIKDPLVVTILKVKTEFFLANDSLLVTMTRHRCKTELIKNNNV